MTEPYPEGESDARTLLAQADDMPYGEARTLLTERALRLAEQDVDHELVFDILAELIPTYRYGGEAAKSLSSFVRMVSEYDAGHGAPPDWAAHTVRWYYKWAVSLLLDYPQFSMDRITSVLDEMERRYVEDGQSLHAVYQMRYRVAAHIDDTEQADHWYAKWIAAPADNNADCAGCNPNSRVGYLTWRDRDEDAIELAAPVLQGHLTCREQPHSMLTSLLLAYVRTGRLDAAVDAHRRAYRVHRGEVSDLGQIGTHVRFCALTGNETRGLEIVERHLPWLDRYTTPDDAADFASEVALLLGRLPRETVVHTGGVRIGSELTELAERTEAGELADRLLAWAYEIGARFDARNGNSSYSDNIARNQAREPLLEHLPLSPYARRGPGPAGSEYAESLTGKVESGSVSNAGAAATAGSAAAGAWPAPVSETDPAALLDLAEEHWWNDRRQQAIACWKRFDEVVPTDESGSPAVEPVLLGRRAEGLAFQAFEREDLDSAEQCLRVAQERFTEAEATARWWAIEGLAARVLLARSQPEQAAERGEVAVDRLRTAGDPRAYAFARVRWCQALLVVDPERMRDVLPDLLTSDDPALRARARFEQARLYATEQRFEEALAELDRGLQDARAVGSERTFPALAMRAALLTNLSEALGIEDTEVRSALDALVDSALWPDERTNAHLMRGQWLLRNDQPEDATPDLAEAVAELTAIGASNAQCWIELGEAYLRSERPMDAAEVLEDAIGLIRKEHRAWVEEGQLEPEQPTDPDLTFAMRRTRYLLAQAKNGLGERTEALADLEAVARAEEALGDRQQAASVLEEWAIQLSELDRDDTAAATFAEAAEHYAAVDDHAGQVRSLRKQGLCLFYGPDEVLALPVFERARTVLRAHAETLEDELVTAEFAMLDLNEAKTLDYLGRGEEARARARSAVDGFRKLGAESGVREASMYLDPEERAEDDPDD